MISPYEDRDVTQILELQRTEFTGSDDEILKAIAEGYCLVDKSRGSDMINGYIIVTCPDVPYIYSIAVARDMRGYGIATKLIAEAEHWHKQAGYRKIWLKTTIENPAQTLYFKLGYRISEYDPQLYGPGLPGIVMTKRL
jgi:ribosomal protein S18 acetylase RimI-like enzyme